MTFYILPLGAAGERHPVLLARMRDFAEAWFGLPALVLPGMPLPAETWAPERARYHSTRLLARLADRRPTDARLLAAVTSEDLFTQGLPWVFGEGSPARRCAVCSVRRLGTPDPALFLRRALKLLAHEAGHALSLPHCTRDCVMRSSDTLRDLDRHPLRICREDLATLAAATGVDPTSRDRRLRAFYRVAGLAAER